MWNWINCYLSGRHDYGVWCEPGAVFLRCVHCGKRSNGWSITAQAPAPFKAARVTTPARAIAARVVPFRRAAS